MKENKLMNFLEALKQPIGTEFIEENTKDYYRIGDTQELLNSSGNDITSDWTSNAISGFKFRKI